MSTNIDTKACTEDGDISIDEKVKKSKPVKEKGGQLQQSEEQEQTLISLLQLTDDLFLLLLTTHLNIEDALQLGSTCRRLYGLYRDSCKSRNCLMLFNAILPCEDNYAEHDFEDMPSALFPEIMPADFQMMDGYVSTTRSLFALLPNLVVLVINDIVDCERALPHLVKVLNTYLTKLQSLSLYLYSSYEGSEALDDRSPMISKNGRRRLRLQLPLLKHLTLGVSLTTKSSVKLVFKSPLLRSVFPQLSSFHFASCDYLADTFQFISKHVYPNAQLQAAAENGSPDLQIAIFFYDESNGFLGRILNDELPTDEEANSLALLTFAHVSSGDTPPEKYLQWMRNLRSVAILLVKDDLFPELHDEENEYPAILTLLATLPHLKEINVDCEKYERIFDGGNGGRFRKQELPVMPSVQTFRLSTYCSLFHADPVEFFQLAHCFSGLQSLYIHINQSQCEYCDYSKAEDVSVFQNCALQMARGLLRWNGNASKSPISTLKKVKATFSFPHDIKFSSLENLVAGVKDD